jgi:hypothetical protein
MQGGREASWREEEHRPSRFWALTVAIMALAGFGMAGAVIAGTAVATHAGNALGAAADGKSVSPQLAARLGASVHAQGSIASDSSNWGGFADTAKEGTIVEATAEWYIPKINCDVYPAIQDNWVGIDGWGTNTVEQAGTYGYCNADGAGPYYWTWFEFFPYESIQSYSMSGVAAGQLVQAYVLYNPTICYSTDCGVYTLVVDDTDSAAASLVVQGNPNTCNANGCEGGPDGSVECISESLVDQGSYLPDYGHTEFYACDVTINGYESGIGGEPGKMGATVYKITTYGYDSDLKQQTPSSLSNYNGVKSTFTLTWHEYD